MSTDKIQNKILLTYSIFLTKLIFDIFFLKFFEGERSSPSSARRRGTDFTQMDAGLWITQAKSDLDAANNDMHPITGKPAYEWVCYKCYRVNS